MILEGLYLKKKNYNYIDLWIYLFYFLFWTFFFFFGNYIVSKLETIKANYFVLSWPALWFANHPLSFGHGWGNFSPKQYLQNLVARSRWSMRSNSRDGKKNRIRRTEKEKVIFACLHWIFKIITMLVWFLFFIYT